MALPTCGDDTYDCQPDSDVLSAAATDSLAAGGTVTLTLDPAVPACADNSGPVAGGWTNAPCYTSISFSNPSLCVAINNQAGGRVTSGTCASLLYGGTSNLTFDVESDDGRNNDTIETYQNCGIGSNYATYIFGGPSNRPLGEWADKAPTALDCRYTMTSERPTQLTGPTWAYFSGSISVRDNGPDSTYSGSDERAGVWVWVGGELDLRTGCNPQATSPFVDLPAAVWVRDAVSCLYDLGLTTGTSPTTFSPNGEVTRVQMAAFMQRMYELLTGEDCPIATTPFNDLPGTSWGDPAIACLYGLGVTTGTSASSFSPSDPVTRMQMAAFIARLWNTINDGTPVIPTTPFTDLPGVAWAGDGIKQIYGLGITTGTTPTTYSPYDSVTRMQMAAFLARLYEAAASA